MAREGDGSVIVAWCPNCEVYVEETAIGERCPMGHCYFHLRRRRGYINEDSEEKNIYWTKRALREAKELE